MAEDGDEIKSFQSMILDLPPSCIEFCPRYPSLFLVGTYYLETSEAESKETETDEDGVEVEVEVEARQAQSKSGSILVFELKDGQAQIKETIPQPSAVFDLHFAPQADRADICAAVSSTGTISFFRLSPGDRCLQALSVLRIPGLSGDDSFTYFTWHPETPGLMAVTTSTGKVILARVQDNYEDITRLRTLLSHDAEAWCAAFSPLSHRDPGSEETLSTVYSGGDDFKMLLKTHATRPDGKGASNSDPEPAASSDIDSDSGETCIPPRNNKGIRHDAGVTAILPLRLATPDGSGVVVTGSYSDHLSVWGILPPYRAGGMMPPPNRLLRRVNLGGGVWRLKVIEELSGYGADPWSVTLLVSCMHAGARVVRLEGSLGAVSDIKVLWRFEEHESMNYGSDYAWVDGRGFFGEDADEGSKIVCVSTSFYDKRLCLWTF
ncbi:hypothetical protein KVR01_007238 [Diaporthe batatas]|uniref:uncharacterized protein n=1 Tax=Diaporthe batatas TaxID=748121 RepID=UPI001D05B244|nr:uncharacterized protein KVR01_007238 [Diaporthe batatas]KAG8162760.1 hypothetical protein KVR01_007238 [Diaporthe batatas]